MGVNIEKVFGEDVFDDAVMKSPLSKKRYEKVKSHYVPGWRNYRGVS